VQKDGVVGLKFAEGAPIERSNQLGLVVGVDLDSLRGIVCTDEPY
jgi:hypothetical protein